MELAPRPRLEIARNFNHLTGAEPNFNPINMRPHLVQRLPREVPIIPLQLETQGHDIDRPDCFMALYET